MAQNVAFLLLVSGFSFVHIMMQYAYKEVRIIGSLLSQYEFSIQRMSVRAKKEGNKNRTAEHG